MPRLARLLPGGLRPALGRDVRCLGGPANLGHSSLTTRAHLALYSGTQWGRGHHPGGVRALSPR